MSEKSPGNSNTTCKLIAAFIALSSHLIMHQIDVTSVHFSVAFNIPLNNISIYFSKLFSFRCMLIAAGTASELVVSEISKKIYPDGNQFIRKLVSMGSFVGVLIIRVVFLFYLYKSSQLGYYVYVILSIEAYFFGYFHASVIGLVPEHSLVVTFSVNASRFFILFIQLILDSIIKRSPLLMIKFQVWIGVIMTGGAVVAWMYFNFSSCNTISALDLGFLEECVRGTSDSNKNASIVVHERSVWEYIFSNNWFENVITMRNMVKPYMCKNIPDQIFKSEVVEVVVQEKGFGTTFSRALSPFLMFFGGSMFKDFLFPGVLPYALVRRDRCHIINMLVPVANILGPLVLFSDESRLIPRWTPIFNAFWALMILMFTVGFSAFMAIHSRVRIFRSFINSAEQVTYSTLILVFCNGFMDPLSFAGVAKIVKKGFEDEFKYDISKVAEKGNHEKIKENNNSNERKPKITRVEGSNSLLTVHILSALFMRFVFSKLSVGYNDTRVSLGYCLPKFRPNHRMSRRNTGWYIFRQTFIRAWKDTGSDFKLDVKKYL